MTKLLVSNTQGDYSTRQLSCQCGSEEGVAVTFFIERRVTR